MSGSLSPYALPAPAITDAAQPPSMADAWQANVRALGDWINQQRAKSAAMGLWNDQTGMPTQAGLVNAAQQYGNGVAFGTIAGPAAKTADLVKLASAKDMAAQGATRDTIWNSTGWFQGPEGNWRYEIPDNQMQRLAVVNDQGAKLGAVIDHPALFQAYPQLRDTIVRQGGAKSGGQFQPGWEGSPANIVLGSNQSPFSLLHEIQHNVQQLEGNTRGASQYSVASAPDLSPHFFAKYHEIAKNVMTPIPYDEYLRVAWGGEPPSPESQAAYNAYVKNVPKSIPLHSQQDTAIQQTAAEDTYKRVAGEVEARATSKRYPMTPDERAATPPWQSYDVPENQQIVRPLDQYANDPLMKAMRNKLMALFAPVAASPFISQQQGQ